MPDETVQAAALESKAASESVKAPHVLSETERKMLQLEARPFKYAGAKQEAIRALLNLSSAAYYQRLNRLIDSEAALAFDPQLVKRLRASRPQAPRASRVGGHAVSQQLQHEDRQR